MFKKRNNFTDIPVMWIASQYCKTATIRFCLPLLLESDLPQSPFRIYLALVSAKDFEQHPSLLLQVSEAYRVIGNDR